VLRTAESSSWSASVNEPDDDGPGAVGTALPEQAAASKANKPVTKTDDNRSIATA